MLCNLACGPQVDTKEEEEKEKPSLTPCIFYPSQNLTRIPPRVIDIDSLFCAIFLVGHKSPPRRRRNLGLLFASSYHYKFCTKRPKVLSDIDNLYCAFVLVGHNWHQEGGGGEEILAYSVHLLSIINSLRTPPRVIDIDSLCLQLCLWAISWHQGGGVEETLSLCIFFQSQIRFETPKSKRHR